MITKKQLIEKLTGVPDDWEVRIFDVQNGAGTAEPICHICGAGDVVILASRASIGTHSGPSGCGTPVFEMPQSEYTGQCPTCDESLYDFEIEFKNDPLVAATPRATYELDAIAFGDQNIHQYQVYEADRVIEDIDDMYYARVTSEQELRDAVLNGEEFCGLTVRSYVRTSGTPR